MPNFLLRAAVTSVTVQFVATTVIPVPAYLEGHEKILEAYGNWPSFHDSEIISVKMERVRSELMHGSTVSMLIHGHTMTTEVLPNGFYRLTNHRLIHFKFQGVSEIRLEGFNHQNVLFDLRFEELSGGINGRPSFRVNLNSSYGLEGEITATVGKVISVDVCDEQGNPISKS